jgi:hypothetical protein
VRLPWSHRALGCNLIDEGGQPLDLSLERLCARSLNARQHQAPAQVVVERQLLERRDGGVGAPRRHDEAARAVAKRLAHAADVGGDDRYT